MIMLEDRDEIGPEYRKHCMNSLFMFLLKRAYSLKGTADKNHRLRNRKKWHQSYAAIGKSVKTSCCLDNLQ